MRTGRILLMSLAVFLVLLVFLAIEDYYVGYKRFIYNGNPPLMLIEGVPLLGDVIAYGQVLAEFEKEGFAINKHVIKQFNPPLDCYSIQSGKPTPSSVLLLCFQSGFLDMINILDEIPAELKGSVYLNQDKESVRGILGELGIKYLDFEGPALPDAYFFFINNNERYYEVSFTFDNSSSLIKIYVHKIENSRAQIIFRSYYHMYVKRRVMNVLTHYVKVKSIK